LVLLYVPKRFGELLLKHIASAKTKAYFEELSQQDLYHGHLLLLGTKEQIPSYPSPEAFFGDVTSVLYHSAEKTDRWSEEAGKGIPVSERTPRSFLGWKDGAVQPAIEIAPKPYFVRNYADSGTVYDSDIAAARPDLSLLLDEKGTGMRSVTVRACVGGDCRECTPFEQVSFVHEPESRFVTEGGKKIDFFVRCEIIKPAP
jgi:hypothetical protein